VCECTRCDTKCDRAQGEMTVNGTRIPRLLNAA
jgi:hypothetical protein